MAENRTSSQKPRRKTSQSSNGASARAKGSASRSKPATRSKATSRSKPSNRGASRSRNGGSGASAAKGPAKEAGKSVKEAGTSVKETASSVKDTAAKAAGPAIALGAAAAGVAGGVLLRGRMRRRKVLGIPVPRSRGLDAKSIAKTVGEASATFAKTSKAAARSIERAGDQAERIGRALGENTQSSDRHRSPVEVVLDGLTHRRGDG